jgi:hypothetical protein
MAYSGQTQTTVNGKQTHIPFPSRYADPADIPSILQDRSEAIYDLVTGVFADVPKPDVMDDTKFQTFLDKFIKADAHRIDSGTSTVTLTAAATDYDIGLRVTAPDWPSVAVINAYINLDAVTVSGTGDVKATLKENATVLAYNEMPVSGTLTGDMHQFTTVQNIAATAVITCAVQRGAARVGTRFIHVVFFRLTSQVAPHSATP